MTQDADLEPDDGTDQFRQMREKANRTDDAEKRAADAERQLAFVKAGVGLDDPRATYFIKGYEGDLSPEAIRTEARSIGIIEGDPGPPPEELEAHRQVNQSSAGAPPPGDTALADDMASIDAQDPLANEKIYAVMVKHGRWPTREF